ncbi:MAG: asparagine synthase-related protein [Alphaproteobacteria bacterium]|nr:asparagine synthase-related protein [Alphaproteobacteria bacterium]
MRDPLMHFTFQRIFDDKNLFYSSHEGIFVRDTEANVVLSHANTLKIIGHHFNPQKRHRVVVIGSPIWNYHVSRDVLASELSSLDPNKVESIVSRINGEFSLISLDEISGTLRVFTDRFSSYPIFWALTQKEFCLSYAYIDLVQHCRHWPGFKLRSEKAYEFFILQRLMGNQTHDNCTLYLEPASCLTVTVDKKTTVHSYWRPDYEKNRSRNRTQAINLFSDLLSQAIEQRFGTTQQGTGLFLSGGHDSRLIAVHTQRPLTCYTLSFEDNYEVQCARRIAQASGHPHVFSRLNQNFFEDSFDVAANLCSGLFATDHSLFLHDYMSPRLHSDIYLHGHGLDFMFQGMYLYARHKNLFGYSIPPKEFLPLPEDLSRSFIDGISYRLKFNFRGLLNHAVHKEFEQHLYDTVKDVEHRAQALSDDRRDHWEYLTFHHLSRHYTFSNILSQRTCGETRTPCLDNNIYDFYLSLPYEMRLNADMMRGALYKKSPHVANLPAANHALPAGWNPYHKAILLMVRKGLRHITMNKYAAGPSGKDRTWPDRDEYFRSHEKYRNLAFSALYDRDFREFLNFLDWDKLESIQSGILNQKYSGAFLITLLSYYRFYRTVFPL